MPIVNILAESRVGNEELYELIDGPIQEIVSAELSCKGMELTRDDVTVRGRRVQQFDRLRPGIDIEIEVYVRDHELRRMTLGKRTEDIADAIQKALGSRRDGDRKFCVLVVPRLAAYEARTF